MAKIPFFLGIFKNFRTSSPAPTDAVLHMQQANDDKHIHGTSNPKVSQNFSLSFLTTHIFDKLVEDDDVDEHIYVISSNKDAADKPQDEEEEVYNEKLPWGVPQYSYKAPLNGFACPKHVSLCTWLTNYSTVTKKHLLISRDLEL